tara:strand:- start:445 stop:975 length:531 start_codon:yes stop_codon:yes gene_type:complete
MYRKDLEYRYKKGNYSKINCQYHKVVKKDKNQIIITPFENDHGHVDESYGFRIDFGSKKIVYSGDTTYSKNVINNSKNADILIHEIIAVSKKIYNNNKKLRKVVSSHTDVNQLIEILKICKPKLTILNHALLFGVSENEVLNLIKSEYKGKVIFSKDLMSIDLGKEINIFNTGNYR